MIPLCNPHTNNPYNDTEVKNKGLRLAQVKEFVHGTEEENKFA